MKSLGEVGKKGNHDEWSAEVINRVKMTAVRQRELKLGGFFPHRSRLDRRQCVTPRAGKQEVKTGCSPNRAVLTLVMRFIQQNTDFTQLRTFCRVGGGGERRLSRRPEPLKVCRHLESARLPSLAETPVYI